MSDNPDQSSVNANVNLAVEQVARVSYGRLLAWLACQWRDIAAAEDALADAFLKALELWPTKGIPTTPDAWIFTVAKRQLLQKNRREKFVLDPRFTELFSDLSADDIVERAALDIPDNRLALMLTCASPQIEESVRMPLMLQTVLGLQVNDIAPAMLMSPASLAQRLVRAKQKIRAQEVVFVSAESRDLPNGLNYLLEAIYGAFGISSDDVDGAEIRILGLHNEAIYLCSLVCELLPKAAEAKGLLALMLFSKARRSAQSAASDVFIALSEQNPSLWDKHMIQHADDILLNAYSLRQPGYFQLEAAVQSAHCHRLFSGVTPWAAIAELYAQINRYFPSPGSRVAGAVACAEAGKTKLALELLHAIDESISRSFQPWWVAKAHILTLMGDIPAARIAYDHAIGLSMQKKIIAHLIGKRDGLI